MIISEQNWLLIEEASTLPIHTISETQILTQP